MKQIAVVTVSDVAFGGKGVSRHEGKVFFIPFTAPGDVVNVRVTRNKKKFAEAEALEIVTPSPDRVVPKCHWFGHCGGCAYQHIAYPAQLTLKHQQVEQTLRRVGQLNEVPMRPIIPSPEHYEYRNRIKVHVENRQVGFYAHASHDHEVKIPPKDGRKRIVHTPDWKKAIVTLVQGDKIELFEGV